MESKELHSRDAKEEDTTFINGHKEVVQQIAYWWSISMFHQGTCSKDKALNEAHMNHMENLQQELAK